MRRHAADGGEGRRAVVTIRSAEPDDWRALRTIRLEALATAPEAFEARHDVQARFDEAEWRRRTVSWRGERGRTLLAVAGEGQPVGMAIALVDEQDAGWIGAMYVTAEWRRRGVARQLLEAAVAWLRERDVTTIRLGVAEGNDAALALYRAAGFRETGVRERLRDDLVDVELELDAQ